MTLLVSWPSITDDSGDGVSGTEIEKSVFDAVKSSVEDQVHSTVNTTTKPKTITDEVITARGATADLNARISGVISSSGALVTPGSIMATADFQESMASFNLVKNPKFDCWTKTGNEPDDWTFNFPAGGSIARDTSIRKIGSQSCAISTGAGAAATLIQSVVSVNSSEWNHYDFEEGNKVVVGVWARTSNGSSARLNISDIATSTNSSFHPGDSNWQLLTATHTISASATALVLTLNVGISSLVEFSGAFLVFSDTLPTRYPHAPLESVRFKNDTYMGGLRERLTPGWPIIIDEFVSGGLANGTVGTLGWLLTQTGAGTIFIGSAAGHPGLVSSNTGANDNDLITWTVLSAFPADIQEFGFIFQLGSAITSYAMWAGLSIAGDRADVTATSIKGIGVYFDTDVGGMTNFGARIENASANENDTDIGLTPVASNWYYFQFRKNHANNFWDILINGKVHWSSTITLDPLVSHEFRFAVRTNTTAARTLVIDWFGVNFSAPVSARYT